MKKMLFFAVLVIVSMTAFAQVSKEEQELIDLSNQKWQWMAEKNADMQAIRSLNKDQRFFNMDYKQAEQFMLNWKIED